MCRFVSVVGQEEQPCDWKSSITVRGSSSRPMAVRACRLLLSPDANTVKGEAVFLRERNFFRASICLNDRAYVTKVVLHA